MTTMTTMTTMTLIRTGATVAGTRPLIAAAVLAALSAPARADAPIVISQVYGGGNSGATYKNDFIEIFNRDTRREHHIICGRAC